MEWTKWLQSDGALNPRSTMPLAHDCHIQVTNKLDVTI